ncbi:hypothetical protein [Ensifer sp. B1-9]|uniref:hypothetical protein n=1 Tax=Ensifer sp. B1-9 TaxID=3141455 RepID=UPI003D2332E1
MVPEILKEMRESMTPFETRGVVLEPRGVRAMLLLLTYLETEWRNMECRLSGTTAVILLDPNSNVVPLKQRSPGSNPGGGAT